ASRPAHHRHGRRRYSGRHAHPHLLDWLHGSRGRLLPLLRRDEPLHVFHADAGHGFESRPALRRLGGRGPVQLPAYQFLLPKKSAADAGKKAFITTRIGDFGFTIGILMAFWTFGSIDYKTMFATAANMPVEGMHQWGVLTSIGLLLLAGAVGKSAQLPLYVWLPDAMEGPTPVSALIHAATMVTAGVYMVARMNVLYSH